MIDASKTVRLIIEVLEEVTALSKAENNEQIDADILQCKADILRAQDITAAYKGETRQESEPQKEDNMTNPADVAERPELKQVPSREDNIPEMQMEPIKPGEDTSAGPREDEQGQAEIPRFDLAEKIMAEQRKITAIKRKAPSKKSEAQKAEPQVGPVGHTIGLPTPVLLEQEQIVAEIVARDIEKFCRSDTLGVRGQDLKDTNIDLKRNTHP